MQMGIVVGTVVATRKEAELEGLKLLIVKGCDFDGKPTGSSVVAVDATIMAIVDTVEIDGAQRYSKG